MPPANKLFKDRITKSNYEALIAQLCAALDTKKPEVLNRLLLGTAQPDLYANHGSFYAGQHKHCPGFKRSAFWEKALCKCLYYFNSSSCTKCCDACRFAYRFTLEGPYQIADYEVPAYYYGKGIGEIDLIIRRGNISYATEVKPYTSRETLLRMAAEILTYTAGYPSDAYQKALAFFEKDRRTGRLTCQQQEYNAAPPTLLRLFQKAGITVFCLQEAGPASYRICKLSSTEAPAK